MPSVSLETTRGSTAPASLPRDPPPSHFPKPRPVTLWQTHGSHGHTFCLLLSHIPPLQVLLSEDIFMTLFQHVLSNPEPLLELFPLPEGFPSGKTFFSLGAAPGLRAVAVSGTAGLLAPLLGLTGCGPISRRSRWRRHPWPLPVEPLAPKTPDLKESSISGYPRSCRTTVGADAKGLRDYSRKNFKN